MERYLLENTKRMFCTDKERQTCDVEKRGCEGCYYNGMSEEDILNEIDFCLAGEYITIEHRQAIEGLLKMYQQEKEKNKKLMYCIDNIRNKLELGDYYNCQNAADDLTRLLGEEVEE